LKYLARKKFGIIDFLNFIDYGHREDSLIVVKAPLKESIVACNQLYRENIKKGYRVIKRYKNIDKIEIEIFNALPEVIIPFVEIFDNEWTVIIRSIFRLGKEFFYFDREAMYLSKALQTGRISKR
jgi:hypothetical protein